MKNVPNTDKQSLDEMARLLYPLDQMYVVKYLNGIQVERIFFFCQDLHRNCDYALTNLISLVLLHRSLSKHEKGEISFTNLLKIQR